jgi:3-methyladenine DNA glycosylase/8-oxoguanine DNA glycosylase
MNDILSKALDAHQPDSEQLLEALEVLSQSGTAEEKQSRLIELADDAPEHEQIKFDELSEAVAREQLDGR